MSSWLSLNPFKLNQQQSDQQEEDHGGGGVKEDLSELGKSLRNRLWGVASFLAPPPRSSSSSSSSPSSSEEGGGDSSGSSQAIVGIRNDLAEISGSLKSGFSLISTNKAVNEISRLASNFLQLNEPEEDDDDDDSGAGVVGVSKEPLEFVGEISSRPECWIDFPLSLDDYDFDMSNVQRDHAMTVEQLTPSLADLRMKLCPSHMKEEHFWMIYFILLHPRLDENDSELLSTTQIVEARDFLLQTVQNRTSAHLQTSKADDSSLLEVNDQGSEVQEKEVLTETVNAEHQEDVDVDRWLKEDVETVTSCVGQNLLGNEQDLSFSDLEDDDSDALSRRGGTSLAQNVQSSSPNDSSGWVQLGENSERGGRRKAVRRPSQEKDSESEESNEWLNIDEFDSDNVGTA